MVSIEKPFDLEKINYRKQRLLKRRRLIKWSILPVLITTVIGIWFCSIWILNTIAKQKVESGSFSGASSYLEIYAKVPLIEPAAILYNYGTSLTAESKYEDGIANLKKALTYTSDPTFICVINKNLVTSLVRFGDDQSTKQDLKGAEASYMQALSRISEASQCFKSDGSGEGDIKAKLEDVRKRLAKEGSQDNNQTQDQYVEPTDDQKSKIEEVQKKADQARRDNQQYLNRKSDNQYHKPNW